GTDRSWLFILIITYIVRQKFPIGASPISLANEIKILPLWQAPAAVPGWISDSAPRGCRASAAADADPIGKCRLAETGYNSFSLFNINTDYPIHRSLITDHRSLGTLRRPYSHFSRKSVDGLANSANCCSP